MTLNPPYLAAICLLSMTASSATAQQIKVTHRNVPYDDKDPAQVLDVYLAKSDAPLPAMIHIHGGGWEAGSKNNVPGWLKRGVSEGLFSVVSVEYRFTQVAPHPAQTNDCLRAIQFVRQHSKEWNIDPARLGATGGSAGGHLSLYVGLHDDVADKTSTDAVQQQSSRVACAVGFAGPTDWNLLADLEHKHPAYRRLLGYKPRTPFTEMNVDAVKDVSPLTFVSKDDPPIMIVHGDADKIVPVQHATRLHEKLRATGVTSKLIIVENGNHGVSGAGGREYAKKATEFVQQVFAMAP